ncbi:MAG TPA: beta-hydroxyacyl-ACP dehydratase [Clostridiales bacterium]|nr:beta-hydroxyacyl-ACP dehydratase [Clostridiales bacterium]
MNIMEINRRIKQRPPFQMIERVIEWTPSESAVGIKNVSVNEPYFVGHFPGAPIMPGVLITEACAQLCSLVVDTAPSEDMLWVLLKIDNFKFMKPVIPGDRLEITVKKTRDTGLLLSFDAVVRVEGEVRAKGALTFTSVPKATVFSEGDGTDNA